MGCRRTAPVDSLLRVSVRSPDGVTVGVGPGRGAWLCRGRPECLERAVRRGALPRALRTEVRPEGVETLRKLFAAGGPPGEATGQVCEDGAPGRRGGPPPDEEEGP